MLKSVRDWFRGLFLHLEWLDGYDRSDARGDAVAGLTVGVILVPQSMAYAVIAGMPPIYGLYAGLLPLLAYPLLGTSRQLAVGPVAIDMLIVAAGVGALAAPGSARYVTLTIALAAGVGFMQIGMSALRLGFIADLLARPVISGFTSAAALIIGFSQLGNLLGVDLPRSEFVHVLVREAVQRAGEVHGPSLALGLGCLALIAALQRWKPSAPDALVVTVLGTLLTWALELEAWGVAVIGSVPTGLPAPAWPLVSPGDLRDLLPTVLTLALVQFMSVASLGRVFAARHGYAVRPNRELLAVGAANALGSVFRALPVSGSFSRSAVNDRAGARSPLANVAAALVVVLTLLVLTPLFYYLPYPALAAIIIMAAVGLVDVSELRALYYAKRRDGLLAVFTALTTLVVGIQEGLLLGVAASVLLVLYQVSRPNMVELGHLPGTHSFRDRKRRPGVKLVNDLLLLRVDASFSFANAEAFKDFILEKSRSEDRSFRAVLIDGSSINDLDTTGVAALETVLESLNDQDIELHLAGLIGPVRETVDRSGLRRRVGEDYFHRSLYEGVVYLLERWDAEDGGQRLKRYWESVHANNPEPSPGEP
jgi:SulP family sulfate permease